MNVSNVTKYKRAIRQFNSKPIPEEITTGILNAGRRAQSAKNMQPWHFIAIQDKNRLHDLSILGYFAGHLSNASLGVCILTPPPEQRFSILFDAGQAAAYMQLFAWELGIGSCLATIYQHDEARELLGFPEDLTLHIAISFGYPEDNDLLTRPPQKGGRRPMDEILHLETW